MIRVDAERSGKPKGKTVPFCTAERQRIFHASPDADLNACASSWVDREKMSLAVATEQIRK
jgi:hypothetical protein